MLTGAGCWLGQPPWRDGFVHFATSATFGQAKSGKTSIRTAFVIANAAGTC